MDFTTKTISKSILRFLLISLSALTIASCSKNNDEEDMNPEEPISSIEITNINDGDVITEEPFVLETVLTTASGSLLEPIATVTNVESNEEVTFDLIGKIPKINGSFTTKMTAEVSNLEAGEYEISASFRENSEGVKAVIESEKITITVE